MNTLEMARAAGFVILLDGKIGRETYQSVTGSLLALQRFQALCGGVGCDTYEAGDAAVRPSPVGSGGRRDLADGSTELTKASAHADQHRLSADSCESFSPVQEGCGP